MRLDKKILPAITTALLLLPSIVFATTPNPLDKSGDYNTVLISLICLMLTLLFVIGALANVLSQMASVVRDKDREEKQAKSKVVKTVLLLLALSMPALPSMAAEAEKVAAPAVTQISGIPVEQFYTIIGVIALELVVIFAMALLIRQLLGAIRTKPELKKAAEKIAKKSWFWDKFNAAAPVEREKDILLDHNYDGIQELDNSLPPWWKYGFYLTIVVAFIYMYRYHVDNEGLTQQDEYIAEMQQGEEDKAAYLAKSANNVDENTVTMVTDANELAAGKDIFIKACAACHLADGGGTVGPNLTDEYWLHGGGIKDIFKSIKYGWQDKGMKSWKDDYSPKQIQQLAGFIKSLKGTHPATPKAPQGDLYIEASDGSVTDSTKAENAVQIKTVAVK